MRSTHHTSTISALGQHQASVIAAGRPVLRARNSARYLMARPNDSRLASTKLASAWAKLFRSWCAIAKQTAAHLAGLSSEMCLGPIGERKPARVVVRGVVRRGFAVHRGGRVA